MLLALHFVLHGHGLGPTELGTWRIRVHNNIPFLNRAFYQTWPSKTEVLRFSTDHNIKASYLIKKRKN
jgi:hypothetical protein